VNNGLGVANYDYSLPEGEGFIRFYILTFNKNFDGFQETPLFSIIKQLEIYQEQLLTTRAILQNRAMPAVIGTIDKEYIKTSMLGGEVAGQYVSEMNEKIQNHLKGSVNAGKALLFPTRIDIFRARSICSCSAIASLNTSTDCVTGRTRLLSP
jgi:hypothetical protein